MSSRRSLSLLMKASREATRPTLMATNLMSYKQVLFISYHSSTTRKLVTRAKFHLADDKGCTSSLYASFTCDV
jgi:hypothetical protein